MAEGGIVQTLQLGVQAMNALTVALKNVFPQQGGTSTSAVAGAATLPASPVGFLSITLPNGTTAKVPYYS